MTPTEGYTYVPDALVREIGDTAAILACRLDAFAEACDGQTANVSISFLQNIFGWSANKVRRAAETLEQHDLWWREGESGNGGTSIWHKGSVKRSETEGLTYRNETFQNGRLFNKNILNKKRDNKLSPKKDDEPVLFDIPVKAKKKIFRKPSVEDVRAYCAERANGIDAQAFMDHYESVGWMVGKNHMKDWKAAVRTWENNEKNKSKRNGNSKYHTSPAEAARAAELGIALADAEAADE